MAGALVEVWCETLPARPLQCVPDGKGLIEDVVNRMQPRIMDSDLSLTPFVIVAPSLSPSRFIVVLWCGRYCVALFSFHFETVFLYAPNERMCSFVSSCVSLPVFPKAFTAPLGANEPQPDT